MAPGDTGSHHDNDGPDLVVHDAEIRAPRESFPFSSDYRGRGSVPWNIRHDGAGPGNPSRSSGWTEPESAVALLLDVRCALQLSGQCSDVFDVHDDGVGGDWRKSGEPPRARSVR